VRKLASSGFLSSGRLGEEQFPEPSPSVRAQENRMMMKRMIGAISLVGTLGVLGFSSNPMPAGVVSKAAISAVAAPRLKDSAGRVLIDADGRIYVNGVKLSATQEKYVNWVARWTIPNLQGARSSRVALAAQGTWWSLREGVLSEPNAWLYGNPGCQASDGYRNPVYTIENSRWTAWQVGIAAGQVYNYSLADLENKAYALFYPIDRIADKEKQIQSVLARTAAVAGIATTDPNYAKIVNSTGQLRRSWLLRNHLVGFTTVPPQEVVYECINRNATNIGDCYGQSRYPDETNFARSRSAMLTSLADLQLIYGYLAP
jgi:hypothetical protein